MKFIELYDENGVIEHLKAMNDELLNSRVFEACNGCNA